MSRKRITSQARKCIRDMTSVIKCCIYAITYKYCLQLTINCNPIELSDHFAIDTGIMAEIISNLPTSFTWSPYTYLTVLNVHACHIVPYYFCIIYMNNSIVSIFIIAPQMAVMVFKRTVFETRRKPKGLLRPKTRANLKDAAGVWIYNTCHYWGIKVFYPMGWTWVLYILLTVQAAKKMVMIWWWKHPPFTKHSKNVQLLTHKRKTN